MPKKCPDSVKAAGAQLVKTRRMAAALVEQIIVTRAAVKATLPEMVRAGAREMEAGAALERLMDAARCEGLIGAAHDSLRAVLGRLDFEEPTNADISAILGGDVAPMGGGGGRR